MIKFTVKAGIATAAVYYVNQQGVWSSSNDSEKILTNYKQTIKPYVQDVKAQIPIELPELPEADSLATMLKLNWNRGVLATFNFLKDLPTTVGEWTTKGVDSVMQNKEISDFIGSFSAKQENVEKK